MKEQNIREERTLKVIATCILVLGLIATVLCVIFLCFPEQKPWFDPLREIYRFPGRKFDAQGIAPTIGVFLSSILVWSVLRVIAKISINIKRIAEK